MPDILVKKTRSPIMAIIAAAWFTTVTAGAWGLSRYANTPGMSAKAPIKSPLANDTGALHLIMCVHPQCPCSRASISELDVLMARCQSHLTATVLFVNFAQLHQDVTQTELWKSAANIPGVRCVIDTDGKLSDQLHAQTSGQTFLYDAAQTLRFSGGITAARGHAGDNDGLLAIESIVNHSPAATQSTPVFGCQLR